MDELIHQMKVALASTFAFYLKAHSFHWNIEGPDFMQYHSLFERIYVDSWNAVDGLAEHIRVLDSYVPGTFSRFSELSLIEEQLNIPTPMKMINEIELDNRKVMGSLIAAEKLASDHGQMGLTNYLQDRIDTHSKQGWMLKATLKAI